MITDLLALIGRSVYRLHRLHWFMALLMISLSVAGVYFIRSATELPDRPELHGFADQQVMWIGVGLVAFFGLALVNYRFLVNYGLWIYLGSVVLLVATLFIGEEVNNARSWIRIPGVGNLQPAELAKIAYTLGLACFYVHVREQARRLWSVIVAVILFIVPVLLILKQPDAGSASVFAPITFMIMLAASTRWYYLATPAVGAVALLAVCYVYVYQMDENLPGLKPYQNDRIRTFFDPSRDPRGAGWNISQSLIAVGSGGLYGKGYRQGTQNIYGFLPKNITYNDFIFALICEEFGFVGGSLIIIGEGLLLLCIVQIAIRASDCGGVFVASGIAGMFLAHYFVNIGMTIQVTPITGIPLPFISYGGTFMASCMAALGILQNIWIERDSHDREPS